MGCCFCIILFLRSAGMPCRTLRSAGHLPHIIQLRLKRLPFVHRTGMHREYLLQCILPSRKRFLHRHRHIADLKFRNFAHNAEPVKRYACCLDLLHIVLCHLGDKAAVLRKKIRLRIALVAEFRAQPVSECHLADRLRDTLRTEGISGHDYTLLHQLMYLSVQFH